MTPEGKVKNDIKRILKAFDVHYDMPVNHGFGRTGVDFHCCVCGPNGYAMAFYIEAKEKGKHPTALQWEFLNNRQAKQGATCFVIDGPEGLDQLTHWLETYEHSRAA
jgi:hypothetical protein